MRPRSHASHLRPASNGLCAAGVGRIAVVDAEAGDAVATSCAATTGHGFRQLTRW